ncbi:hypothetical protein RAM80_04680 [Pseudomonas sp. App30]|uniref:hypothetical protein n=1 Tax=Pseudomonas sp. App30 TaxID=3068990 RepID=UPI003A80EAB5
MSNLSALNVFKSLSKAVAQQQGWQLSVARKRLSIGAGFSSYHELQSVASGAREDARLLRFTFGVEKFSDVIFLPEVANALEEEVIRWAVQDELNRNTPEVRVHISNLLAERQYDPDRGVLIASATADLTRIESFRYGQQFECFDAAMTFDVRFRDYRWQLVSTSMTVRLKAAGDDGLIEDSINDFPSSEFWD